MTNILVIEDNKGVAELISAKLEDCGFNVSIAFNGNQAIEFLFTTPFDMVIMDYSLPDMDGKEIISILRNRSIELPPFIVSTGRGDEQLAVDMMKLGAYDYLIKDKTLINRLPEVVAKLEHEIKRDKELKVAQVALKESEERFRNFVEKASDFFVKISSDGLLIYFSPNWQVHLGYDFNEISLQAIYPFIHPEDSEKLFNDIRDAIQAENNQFASEYRIVDKSGNWKTHFVKGYSVKENEKLYVNCIARDITERKIAAKKLARAVFEAEEKEKRRFAEHLHEGIGPLISAIKLSIGRLKSLDSIDARGLSIVEYSDKLVDDAVRQIRNLANELLPNIIIDFGLMTALKAHANQLKENGKRSVICNCTEDLPGLEKITSVILFRVITELISIMQKASCSSPILAEFGRKEKKLIIRLTDSESTLTEWPEDEVMNVSLQNMKNKIESLDGSLSIANVGNRGVDISIVVPL
jgi:PAS domain S-box-containing protein